MDWETMMPEQRDRLVHVEIMKRDQELCHDGQLDPFMGGYWRCSCGWISDFFIGEGSTEHTIPIPRYTQSLDAAWLVVEQLHNIELEYDAFYRNAERQTCNAVYIRGDDTSIQAWAHTMPEAICKVALKAKGVDLK